MSAAIESSGRSMLYSLSPGADDNDWAKQVVRNVSMYRVTGDTWDRWDNIKSHFLSAQHMQPYIAYPQGRYGLPAWPDLGPQRTHTAQHNTPHPPLSHLSHALLSSSAAAAGLALADMLPLSATIAHSRTHAQQHHQGAERRSPVLHRLCALRFTAEGARRAFQPCRPSAQRSRHCGDREEERQGEKQRTAPAQLQLHRLLSLCLSSASASASASACASASALPRLLR